MTLAALAATALVPAAPAKAEQPFYYHRPAVERAAFDSELGTCIELARGASPKMAQLYSPNPYAAAIGSFFGGIMASRERRTAILSIMRTCMADKGYRRVVAPQPVAQELKHLDDERRSARLFELATAAAPLGEVLPR